MQQFIPFEDEWEALEALPAEMLVPYRVGLPLHPAQSAAAPSLLPGMPATTARESMVTQRAA